MERHNVLVWEDDAGTIFAGTDRQPLEHGGGLSVLEAIGQYALRANLVNISQIPVMLMAEKYRVDPHVNRAKLVTTGPEMKK